MANKPHIKLNSQKQKEDSVKMDFNYGFENKEEESDEVPRNDLMIESFRTSLVLFSQEREKRSEERNEDLDIPAHIEYIHIEFQNQFDLKTYNQSYYNDFGLLVINLSNFNRNVLFAVINEEKFNTKFLSNIEYFILKESGENNEVEYNGKVKFIKGFKLLTTQDILIYDEYVDLMNFKLIEFPGGSEDSIAIYYKLIEYLEKNNCSYRLIENTVILEVFNATQNQIEEIAKNFDIVLNVTSSLSTVVHPTGLNLVEKTFGFEISNSHEDLPIIGILDTGISNLTPLRSILINDESFNLTPSSPFIDNANGGYGHGTSVGALAALGRRPYGVNYRGAIQADSKLLSMKILDANNGSLSVFDVITLLKKAKSEYPEIKLFVLTTCYSRVKNTNEEFSSYTAELDRFSHENNCLIFICTSNNNRASNQSAYDLNYFNLEETNICTPAESMNNVIVGAAADNLSDGVFMGISLGREFPTLYSRKSHIDLSELFPFNKQNKNLFRPDVIEAGGDYEQGALGFIATGDNAVMQVLSSNPTRSFYKDAGTSFSTPLVANIAAQIQKNYPLLRAQTIKALIINAASIDKIRFDNEFIKLRNKTAGHGMVNPTKSIISNDNSITLIIEDEISPEEMKLIPLNFPKYLTEKNLGKVRGIVKISATLCFSFEPVPNNQLAYCPINMAFSIFRNHSADDILRSENEKEGGIKSKLKNSWSQNNRWKSNPIPASNTQKITFPINVKDLYNEKSTFKLAIHCLINSQLLTADKYLTSHPFSLVITIEENLNESKLTGKLYNEIIAINEVENIVSIETEAEGDIKIDV